MRSGHNVPPPLTFPGYSARGSGEEVAVDTSVDIDLFCEAVAPALGISVRFAGEEPSDPVTARYNRVMADKLPQAGIEFRVIPRFAAPGGGVISARAVRELACLGAAAHAGELRRLVPAATLEYLLERERRGA